MKYHFLISLLLIYTLTIPFSFAQDTAAVKNDTLVLSGQAAGWGQYRHTVSPYLRAGARYIPALNYTFRFQGNKQIDFESSMNISGSLSTLPLDTLTSEGRIKPYRLWARYSTPQLEIRAGLQKINFGPAAMMRALMWFDRLDPRDPLKLTDGVWGILGRYYFLNNANLWLWCLYGNKSSRPWETGYTNHNIPEFGGRFQNPLFSGETGVTYHFRNAGTIDWDAETPEFSKIPEHRIGIDGRFDAVVGLWFEAAWIHKTKNIGKLTNQRVLTLGTDYTFGTGNGIHVTIEQLFFSSGEKPFEAQLFHTFSALSAYYMAGITDNLSAIIFYDWKNKNLYNFISWNHSSGNFRFYVMGYWNPENYFLPQQRDEGEAFAGPGIQIMIVFNH